MPKLRPGANKPPSNEGSCEELEIAALAEPIGRRRAEIARRLAVSQFPLPCAPQALHLSLRSHTSAGRMSLLSGAPARRRHNRWARLPESPLRSEEHTSELQSLMRI